MNYRSRTLSADSRAQIQEYVKKMLEDPSVNLYLIPDPLEASLYEAAICIAIGAISNLLETAKLQILGHEIRFVMNPLPEDLHFDSPVKKRSKKRKIKKTKIQKSKNKP